MRADLPGYEQHLLCGWPGWSIILAHQVVLGISRGIGRVRPTPVIPHTPIIAREIWYRVSWAWDTYQVLGCRSRVVRAASSVSILA